MTESRLNGLRLPLIVNGVTMAPIAIVLITMWADVRELKRDRLALVSGERIARLESQVQTGTELRYRSTDAAKDFQLRDERIDSLQRQVNELRMRMDMELK